MKSLFLALAGASELQELSIIVKPRDQASSDVDPADILWPLLLLPSKIKFKFEGITADPERMSTKEHESSPELDAAFCQHIAVVRQLCNSKFAKPGWEERCWAFHRMRDAEKMLYDLQSPGKKVLCLDDIFNMSQVWQDMRRGIDRTETSDSEQ